MEKHGQGMIYTGLSILILLLVGVLIYGFLTIRDLTSENASLRTDLATTKVALNTKDAETSTLTTTLEELRQAYSISEENGSELLKQLTDERDRNDAFEDQISDITGTVGKLDKLAKTDPELLIKYSRVYFLNENYKPAKVVRINSDFVLKKEEDEYIQSQVALHLNDLLDDATEDGIDLRVVSAFRSFDEQMGLKNSYTTTYGSGANAFSADQGYSEHQLGTTIDLTTAQLGGLTGFETTDAYAWLQKNAYKYGFILSYPSGNAYYIFEPWHWRFVGEKLAKRLHDDGKNFYDLDQREIDKYLISIFD